MPKKDNNSNRPERPAFNDMHLERMLATCDSIQHSYNELLTHYTDYPFSEDIVLSKLDEKFGKIDVENFLDFYNYFDDDFANRSGHDAPPDDTDAPEMDRPPLTPEQRKEEAQFRRVCNKMCGMASSVAISTCNLYSSALYKKDTDNEGMELIYCASLAAGEAAKAVETLSAGPEFRNAVILARHSLNITKHTRELLEKMFARLNAHDPSSAINGLIAQSQSATQEFIDFCRRLENRNNHDDEPPF